MEFLRRVFNPEQKGRQEAVKEVSLMLADLFGTKPLMPRIIFATSNEIKKMQGKEGSLVTHNASYIRRDGVVVICEDSATSMDRESNRYRSLAAEFSHKYHKAVGGDNVEGEVLFNFGWVVETRLRKSGNSEELILPTAMINDVVLPRAKKEVPDFYSQSYVLRNLGRLKEADQSEAENSRWHELVEYDIERIKKSEQIVGSYDKLREGFRSMLMECMRKGIPVQEHPAYLTVKSYFHLSSSLGYWLSGEYDRAIGKSVEDFRGFVRIPILPITAEDRSMFEQSLVGLNHHLLSKNLPTIAYNKI